LGGAVKFVADSDWHEACRTNGMADDQNVNPGMKRINLNEEYEIGYLYAAPPLNADLELVIEGKPRSGASRDSGSESSGNGLERGQKAPAPS
jgi:hypothetical protein